MCTSSPVSLTGAGNVCAAETGGEATGESGATLQADHAPTLPRAARAAHTPLPWCWRATRLQCGV